MSEKLKPCPFCGDEAKIEFHEHDDNHRCPREFWYAKVECWCGATQGWSCVSGMNAKFEDINQESVDEIIASWNERVTI